MRATALVFLLSAGPALAQNVDFEEIKLRAGTALFDTACRSCHDIQPSDASYGPPLDNIVGRRAGSYPGYPYSDALGAAGFVWTEPALRAWMEDDQGFVPGTKMTHPPIADRTAQDFLLAYLRALTD